MVFMYLFIFGKIWLQNSHYPTRSRIKLQSANVGRRTSGRAANSKRPPDVTKISSSVNLIIPAIYGRTETRRRTIARSNGYAETETSVWRPTSATSFDAVNSAKALCFWTGQLGNSKSCLVIVKLSVKFRWDYRPVRR